MVKQRRLIHRDKTVRQRLHEHFDLAHPPVVLADIVAWDAAEQIVPMPATAVTGRPAVRTRLNAVLPYLEYSLKLSDGKVVSRQLEDPDWPIFTGETHLQTQPPINPSSWLRYRRRIGKAIAAQFLSLPTVQNGGITGRLRNAAVVTGVRSKQEI